MRVAPVADRRAFMTAAASTLIAGRLSARSSVLAPSQAPKWYRRAIVVDGLGGIVDPYAAKGQTRLSDRGWRELKETGVTAVSMTLLPVGNEPDAWPQILNTISLFDGVIAANPDRLAPIRTAADLKQAKADGHIGLIYATQDTAMIGTALDRLAELKKRGVGVVQLTYNLRNLSGDGALEPDNAGLSLLGHATIERIERERLLLDLAHGGARTTAEALAAAKRPMAISHTGARALHDHPRNVSDEAIKAVADKGGVTGVYFMPYLAASSRPTGDDLIKHIEHVANIGGEDHVSIGTDGPLLPVIINELTREQARTNFRQRQASGFTAPGDGPNVINVVMDYNSIDRFPRLAQQLARRGWSATRLEKLFGANLERLYRDTWGM